MLHNLKLKYYAYNIQRVSLITDLELIQIHNLNFY